MAWLLGTPVLTETKSIAGRPDQRVGGRETHGALPETGVSTSPRISSPGCLQHSNAFTAVQQGQGKFTPSSKHPKWNHPSPPPLHRHPHPIAGKESPTSRTPFMPPTPPFSFLVAPLSFILYAISYPSASCY